MGPPDFRGLGWLVFAAVMLLGLGSAAFGWWMGHRQQPPPGGGMLTLEGHAYEVMCRIPEDGGAGLTTCFYAPK